MRPQLVVIDQPVVRDLLQLLDTGARYNEIARLEWNNIDLKRKTIELWRGKTKTASYVYMTDRVHRVLQRRSEHKLHDQWIFTNGNRTSHRTDNTTYINQLVRSTGVPLYRPYPTAHLCHEDAKSRDDAERCPGIARS